MPAPVSEAAAPPASVPATEHPCAATALRQHQRRTVWWLFGPLALLAGTRFVLQWLADRSTAAPALPLQLFSGDQDPTAQLITIGQWLASLAGVVLLAAWAWRVFGAAPVRRVLLTVWCTVCLAGAAWQVGGHVNAHTLQPLPDMPAQVVGSRFQKPTSHGVGGTLVVLRISGFKGLRQLLIDDPAAAEWKPGQWLQLQWARGRYGGRFVTGWQAMPGPPAGQEGGSHFEKDLPG